ncbi:MAG TPA: nucleoside phosphorylase [Candidatus Korarchaeota archaeon]|nr:nucleoside phosphorylase [Candidatus Korarchaeota archaeon]
MSASEVLPHLLISPGEVPDRVILTGDPGRVDFLASLLEDPRLVSQNREFRLVAGEFQGREILIASTGIGGPSAGIAIYELARAGVSHFIRVGTTGALKRGVKIGSAVVPHGAVRMDGTSNFYAPPEFPAVPDPRLTVELADVARDLGIEVLEGIIVSMDAFYVDEDWLLEQAEEMNLVSVEMECSTLFVMTKILGASSAAILVVDGNIAEGTLKGGPKTEKKEIPEATRSGLLASAEAAMRVLAEV